MIKWQIEKRNIDDLKGYEKNPRKFTEKGLKDLKKSLENCGDANIITINKDNTVLGGHATPKPIALCSRAIKSSSRENETVLDVFGGSGSTLIACEQLNRKCYTMELDEKYCDVILQRWENLTGKKAELING